MISKTDFTINLLVFVHIKLLNNLEWTSSRSQVETIDVTIINVQSWSKATDKDFSVSMFVPRAKWRTRFPTILLSAWFGETEHNGHSCGLPSAQGHAQYHIIPYTRISAVCGWQRLWEMWLATQSKHRCILGRTLWSRSSLCKQQDREATY